MSAIVRVRFITPHGPYNAGEIAGLEEKLAAKLTGGKRPVAVVATDADIKGHATGKVQASLEALPIEVKDFLSARFAADLKEARKGLLDEIEKVRGEMKPLQAQAAEKDALIEKQKARIGELEQLLQAAQAKAEPVKGSKK